MDTKPGSLIAISLIFTYSVLASENKLLPPETFIGVEILSLCSRGELKAYRWIHVGEAGVYLKDCQELKKINSVAPKMLRFVYDREIPARAFRESSLESLEENFGELIKSWKPGIDKFNAGYQNVKKGNYYDLFFSTEQGLELRLNDKPLANLENEQIAQAYFAIWFGTEPFSESLKASLLTPLASSIDKDN